MKSVTLKQMSLASVLVLLLCNFATAELLDLYIDDLGSGVSKYAYDTVTHAVTKDTGFVCPISSTMSQPQGMAIGPDNLLWVACQNTKWISGFNRLTGELVTQYQFSSGDPTGIEFGPDISGDGVPDLYVGTFNTTVSRMPTAGPDAGTQYIFTSGGNLTLSGDVEFGPDGNLYVSGFGDVEKFDGATGAYIGQFCDPTDNTLALAFNADGSVLYTGVYATVPAGGVSTWNASTGAVIADPFGTGLVHASSVTFGPDFNNNGSPDLYIGHPIPGDGTGNQIDVIDSVTGANIGPIVDGLLRPKKALFAPVPEPSIVVFLVTGLIGLLSYTRRK